MANWERFQFFWLEQLFMVTREWRGSEGGGRGSEGGRHTVW
jgi:hypothetical protein